ncbi:5-carboxymethyl-2-hydroxymuconate Delta-isomerase [Actinacidiphila oryziradicis]|jgi:5-carboxymethyl-2-hydroxymuconate isomerase|uniref:Isomerase n=1 Tax=Actinacidiphila oryziradicis TaxID=2571141 RepID=A0A4U0SPQ8_9ACTN|nr:isomerase [Actinacidiphila oryziradicis]TKA10181.1 isomerase [Actinacidiphila oryziradicis]
MPQITVDYSDALDEVFDRRGFALALHPLTAKIIGTTVEACKTRFRRVEEIVIADGEPQHAVLHTEFGILAGRTPEVKAELSEAVVALAREHTVAAAPGLTVHISVDVTDLSPAYRKHVGP